MCSRVDQRDEGGDRPEDAAVDHFPLSHTHERVREGCESDLRTQSEHSRQNGATAVNQCVAAFRA
jgi:hypothetical protein